MPCFDTQTSHLQIFDLAIEAGADDVQPVEGEDGTPDGYKVSML